MSKHTNISEEMAKYWQPIETAPKDGSYIFLWDARHDYIIKTYWIAVPLSFHHTNKPNWEYFLNHRGFGGPNFTHWMPLPEGPK